MSYRELRDFTEILRSLGYPRLVSIENFRFPNFALMAEVLEWTVKKWDPNARVPKSIDTETDRVIFVKSCVMALVQKARVRLNPKSLYQSDGHAVREILPVLRLLYRAGKGEATAGTDGAETGEAMQISALRSRVNGLRQEMRKSVTAAAQLPQIGASVYDRLAKEIFAKVN